MSKPQKYGQQFDVEDTFAAVLENVAKIGFWGGLLAIAIAVGFLIVQYMAFGSGTQASPEQAMNNIGLLSKLLIAGVVAFMIGSTFMFWGEETLGVFQLAGAAALFFAPLYLPSIVGATQANDVGPAALGHIQMGGMIFGLLALCVLIADITGRVKMRAKQGSKADLLKYGKGIKEERDIRNVLMGKCWQLPFCRKFVRERCPIYHSKRTCWKERVGCMCEEEVIRNAMENRPIPKDQLAASRYIPVNNKLTLSQKAERCRQCVIYNEHQKHKYKVALPAMIGFFALIYIAGRGPLLGMTGSIVSSADRVISNLTFSKTGVVEKKVSAAPLPFEEILLICFMIVALAYALKLLEYVIFKLKA